MEHKFIISKNNWKQIINYAQSAYDEFGAEIGGMSIMVRKGNVWELKDPVILKQEVSKSECDLDKGALSVWYSKVASENQDVDYRICWWHSHNTMNAFWSPTDKKAIEEYNNSDISFALVVNLREEYKFRVSMWSPLEHAEDIPLIIYDRNRVISKEMTDEVKALCSKPIENIRNNYGGYYRNGNQTTMFRAVSSEYTEASDYETDINYAPIQAALDFAKCIREDFAAGTIKKKVYTEEISTFNGMLAENGISCTVKILTKNKAKELEYSQDISDFIEATDGLTLAISMEDQYGGWS